LSKNSPKKTAERLPSDGSVSPFDTSPDILAGGSGGGTGTAEQQPKFLSFALENVDLSLLPELKPGQAVEFVEESETAIAAIRDGKSIGRVPRSHRKQIRDLISRGGYSAMIEDVSHETVRVRVTE
jgi:hypothetical protein